MPTFIFIKGGEGTYNATESAASTVHRVNDKTFLRAESQSHVLSLLLLLFGGTVVDRLMGANPSRLQELIEEHK